MNTLQLVLMIAVVLSGYLIGKLIAHYTKEELVSWRKGFKVIMIACVLAAILSLLMLKGDNMLLVLLSSIFIFLIAFASLK